MHAKTTNKDALMQLGRPDTEVKRIRKALNANAVRRIATYVNWYTESAYLYIEEVGADIDYLTDLLENLKWSGLDHFDFREIICSSRGKIKIKETPKIFFSTNLTSNPQELN